MAVSTTSTFNNAMVGIPNVGADVDIFDTHTTPKYAVGQRWTRSDGTSYVYSHFGAALSSGGMLVSQDLSESSQVVLISNIYASGSTTAISGETIRPNTVGSHYVEVIFASVTADLYAGAYLQIADGDGFGYQYRIKGNTASSAKTSGANHTYYLELWEPLQKTISTVQTSTFRIVGSKYANLESASGGTDMFVAGVTTCSHAAATWGWIQVNGLAGVRTDASTVAVSTKVYVSGTLPGCVGIRSPMLVTVTPVGTCVASANAAAVANQLIAVDLRLE